MDQVIIDQFDALVSMVSHHQQLLDEPIFHCDDCGIWKDKSEMIEYDQNSFTCLEHEEERNEQFLDFEFAIRNFYGIEYDVV